MDLDKNKLDNIFLTAEEEKKIREKIEIPDGKITLKMAREYMLRIKAGLYADVTAYKECEKQAQIENIEEIEITDGI